MKHSALNAVKYEYQKYREKNYAVHCEVLSAVKYKWFNPQVAFLQRPPSRNLNKIKENKRQRGSSKKELHWPKWTASSIYSSQNQNVFDKKGQDRMLQNLNQTDVAQFVSAAVTSYTIPFPNNKPEISFAKNLLQKLWHYRRQKQARNMFHKRHSYKIKTLKSIVNSESQ